jgi:hypothetical protein
MAATAVRTIAVDIDEVLARFTAALCAWHNEHHGTALTMEDIVSYHFADVAGFGSLEETHVKMVQFFESPHFHSMEPLPGAREVLQRHAVGHGGSFRFVVLTSRSDTLEEATVKFRETHYGPLGREDSLFAAVHYTNAYRTLAVRGPTRTKGEVCLELGAHALIDDNRAYAVEAAGSVSAVILHGVYAWNKCAEDSVELPANCIRTADWAAVDALLHQWSREASVVA